MGYKHTSEKGEILEDTAPFVIREDGVLTTYGPHYPFNVSIVINSPDFIKKFGANSSDLVA